MTTPLTHNKNNGGIWLISAVLFVVFTAGAIAEQKVYYKFNNDSANGENYCSD